jgi:hypothetical protein
MSLFKRKKKKQDHNTDGGSTDYIPTIINTPDHSDYSSDSSSGSDYGGSDYGGGYDGGSGGGGGADGGW